MADSADSARPTSRIAGIEGLRACAAGAIVVLHVWSIFAAAGLLTTSGWLPFASHPLVNGVTLFFVLSGLLLWGPFASCIASGCELPSLRRYAKNRLLRIVPAYWAVLAVSALVLGSVRLVPLTAHPLTGALHDPGLLLRDALLIQGLSPRTLSSGIEPAWSLSVELTFYLVLPLLGLLAAWLARGTSSRSRRLAASLAPVLLLAVVSLTGKLVATFLVPGPEGEFHATWHSVLDRSFLTHADLFAAGMLVAVLRIEHQHGRLTLTPRLRRALNHALVCGPPLTFLGFYLMPHYIGEPIAALCFAVVLAHVVVRPAGERPGRLVRLLERRPLVAAGTASYSAFLWSFPVTVFIAQHGLAPRGSAPWRVAMDYVIVVGAVATLSAVTYLAVERPALRLGRRARVRPDASPPVILATEAKTLTPS